MNNWLVILCSFCYLLLLFAIAHFTERWSKKGRSLINNPYIYSLSLAVYCTGWTYYGSVGRAAVSGMDYVTIFLGPTAVAFLFTKLRRKIIRITKLQRINSIADFISSRYGKNISLAVIVTVFCVLGIIPYISLQIKAMSVSYDIIAGSSSSSASLPPSLLQDSTFYISLVLIAFIILFGTRSVDATEKHEGLVVAIAFESIVKLAAFIAIGLFVSYGIFNGWNDLFDQAMRHEDLTKLFYLNGEGAYLNWFCLILLSMLAFMFLPRQFQIGIVENMQEKHLEKASWLLPLYLLLINLFVLPIALGGRLIFGDSTINADTYVLALPMHFGNDFIALVTYIGGFSAASSMIIVETIALSTMISNHIIMPLFLSLSGNGFTYDHRIRRFLLNTRRITIALIIFLALLYNKMVAEHYSLVYTGLISFIAVAQFAPATIGGIFWKGATKNGAIAGIVVGFVVWFFTLIVPSLVEVGMLSNSLLEKGLFEASFLRPYSLFGLEGIDPISHALFWSLLLNLLFYFSISIFSRQSSRELYQAEIFVDIFKHSAAPESPAAWRGTANLSQLSELLKNFLGKERATKLLSSYAARHKIDLNTQQADPRLVTFSEKILSGVIGAASARIVVSSITKEEEIRIDEVLRILRESQQIIELNKELRKKSIELTKATEQLTKANQAMRDMDVLKDEFLYTVTHEIRTPLTSIRALSEILHDHPDMEEEERQYYLSAIVKETERLSHLITQVLNLERYESGRQKLNLSVVNLNELLQDSIETFQPIARERGIQLLLQLSDSMVLLRLDQDLIRQVMVNLLANAFKFTESGTGMIKVSVHHNYHEWQVWVEDNGKGIEKDLQELVFDKFFQAKNQTLKKPEGTGLGLAICKRIIELHEGKIWVESREGSGARFIFALPIT